MQDAQRKWCLLKMDVYKDSKNKGHSFPLPDTSVQKLINTESLSSDVPHGEYADSLPDWLRLFVRQQIGVWFTAPAPALVPPLYQFVFTNNESLK